MDLGIFTKMGPSILIIQPVKAISPHQMFIWMMRIKKLPCTFMEAPLRDNVVLLPHLKMDYTIGLPIQSWDLLIFGYLYTMTCIML